MLRSLPPTLRTKAFFAIRFMSDASATSKSLSLMETPRRWLYNNELQTSLRRLNFDAAALGEVAAKASGASACNKIEFLAEGGYNRVFRLNLSNGKDVIARIPFPNAGPKNLLTRSEVATMDFVRSRLNAPIPKVLAWDATTTNDVGCEYIIMEKCDGSTLQDRLGEDLHLYRHIYDVAELMTGLASIRFSQYGSVYYKEDVDSHLQDRPLYAEGEKEDELSERFRIGPSAERRFYRGERAHMTIDRGPWKDINSYFRAAVDCETEWIRLYSNSAHAKAQLGVWNSAEQHISLMQKWLSLAPAVLPSPEYYAPTLSHPDLHAGNVFVTGEDPLSVTGFIDWQGAAVCPLFETETPNIFNDDDGTSNMKYVKILSDDHFKPILPANFAKLTADEQEEARMEFRHLWPRHAFHKFVRQSQGPLLTVLRLLQMELLKHAVYGSSHSWSDGLPTFERTLMLLSAEYGDSIPAHSDYPVCPVVFSEDDQKRHEKEYEDIVFTEQLLETHVMKSMQKAGIYMLVDGAVDLEDFDAAVQKNNELLTRITTGKSEAVQERIRRRWPIREGKFVYSMESCR